MTAIDTGTHALPQPPQDLAAEQAVLGGMMMSPDIVDTVLSILDPDDLYHPAHQSVAHAISGLHSRSEPVDPIAVAAELGRRKLLDRVGGAPALLDLVAAVPVAASAPYYAQIVAEKATHRRIVAAGQRLTQLGYQGGAGADTTDVVEAAAKITADIHKEGRSSGVIRLRDALAIEVDRLDDDIPPGVPTGLADLDRILRLTRGSMTVIGARPGGGKSVLAMQIALHTASRGAPALMCSLEMSQEDLIARVVASQAAVRLDQIVGHKMDDDEWMRVAKAQARVDAWPLDLSVDANLRISMVRRIAADAVRRGEPYEVIVLDYIGLMSPDAAKSNRQQEVSDLSRAAKLLAQEFRCAVVVAAQLNRGGEQRADKRPVLSDLRESGSLEQDADNVLFPIRDDEQRPGEVEIIVAKQRQGPTGSATCAFQGHYQRIVGLSKQG